MMSPLCVRVRIFWLAAPADYRSINTEPGAMDMINRYGGGKRDTMGAQMLKEKYWDHNQVNMDYKMEETEA